MAYTVRKLLESEQFPKMKLLCGEKGLDLEVKGIRIIEIEDMERYLTGGEILITSFQVYLSLWLEPFMQHRRKRQHHLWQLAIMWQKDRRLPS